MDMMDKEIIEGRTQKKLGEIIKRNKEAENSYRGASDRVGNSGLSSFFRRRSEQWKKFGASLKHEIAVAFPALAAVNDLPGHIKDTWLDTAALSSSDSDASMLQISMQGDRAAVKTYGKLLEGNKLPFTIYQLIRKHKMRIEVDLFKIKGLSDLR